MQRHTFILALTVALAGVGIAQAQGPSTNCIELRNEVQMEQEVTDANGQKSIRLVPPAKVVPGNHVIYTITAHNLCRKPVDKVVVNNPVPEHLSYVADSATGAGTEISYSADGRIFAKPGALMIKDADGSVRAPRDEEIRSIRWVFSGALAPGQSSSVRFRAAVN
jgi:uncharacterized repeat protein (TIGR01451 family)